MLKGHGNDHNSNDPCILCKCASTRYTLSQPAQNDPRLSLYKRVGTCKVGSLPSTYLGMSLGAPFKSVAVWDGVEERFCKRLAMWKRQYISKGGRITLIRSTLSNLPIYFMSILQMPRGVKLRLEKI
ncbi:hypothetical protein AAG906_024678 [Vitis piasezkii]